MAIYRSLFEGQQNQNVEAVFETADLCTRKNMYLEGAVVENCEIFITDEMVSECHFNVDLIEQAALLEGAKIDIALKNFIDEGEDYKGLKRELKKIIDANNMSKEELQTGKNGFMHVCKRILQILLDISICISTGFEIGTTIAAVANVGQINKVLALFGGKVSVASIIIKSIAKLIVGFIINRLLRYAVDAIEFAELKKDAKTIVEDLRTMAKKAESKKDADKFNKEADRLEDAIAKYSHKHDK